MVEESFEEIIEVTIDIPVGFEKKQLGNEIPKGITTNFNLANSQLEVNGGLSVKKQVFLSAVIHEGLNSENLIDRVEEYDEIFEENGN